MLMEVKVPTPLWRFISEATRRLRTSVTRHTDTVGKKCVPSTKKVSQAWSRVVVRLSIIPNVDHPDLTEGVSRLTSDPNLLQTCGRRLGNCASGAKNFGRIRCDTTFANGDREPLTAPWSSLSYCSPGCQGVVGISRD